MRETRGHPAFPILLTITEGFKRESVNRERGRGRKGREREKSLYLSNVIRYMGKLLVEVSIGFHLSF